MAKDPSLKVADLVVKERRPAASLSKEVEDKLKQFVDDAQKMGIPRTKGRLADDIQTYVNMENIKVAFPNNRPGRCSKFMNMLKF